MTTFDINSTVPEQRLQSKKQQVQKWQRYTEPGDELEANASSPMKRSSRNLSDDLDSDDEDNQLPEAVLTTNLGLDIVVVATKVSLWFSLTIWTRARQPMESTHF